MLAGRAAEPRLTSSLLQHKDLACSARCACRVQRSRATHIHSASSSLQASQVSGAKGLTLQPRQPAVATSALPWETPANTAVTGAPKPPAKFELTQCVALAGAAFEAYLEPTGGEGFQQRNLNGSVVQYTDKAFLTEVYQGVLQLRLVGATNLRPANKDGTSDPYVQLTVANCGARSKMIPRSLNPKWDETYCMYIRDPSSDVVRIRVFDAEAGRSDQDLGLAMMGLSVLQQQPGHKPGMQSFSLPLKGPGAGSGASVEVEARFLRFTDFEPAAINAMTASGTAAGAGALTNMVQAAAQVPQLLQSVLRQQQEQQQQAAAKQLPDTTAAAADLEEAKAAATAAQEAGTNSVLKAFSDLAKGALSQQEQQAQAAAGNKEAHVAVAEEDIPNPWRALAEMVGRSLDDSFVPVAYVDNPESDTQVWLYRNVATREAIIAFRGTEQVKWKDIATDLNLTPCSLNPERLDANAGLPFTVRVLKSVLKQHDGEEMVHSGFLSAYDAVRPQVFTLLDLITGSMPGVWQVWVTGHSLGGALATLCAYELAARQAPIRLTQAVSLYTYGAPRVGNATFAQRYNALVPNSWRITNSNDIIPSIPRLMGYCHVEHAVQLTSDGRLKVRAESKDVFGEGKGGAEVIQALVKQVAEESRPWDEVYSEIASREMELFNTLVDGRGLEEHMETFYLSSLKEAVAAQIGQEVAQVVDGSIKDSKKQ